MSRSYKNFNYPSKKPGNTLLTGIRQFDREFQVLISGFFKPQPEGKTRSFVYLGPLSSEGAKYRSNFHLLDYPSAPGRTVTSTNLYGPNRGRTKDTIDVVGNYTTLEQPGTFGCLYQGRLDGRGIWRTLTPPNAQQVIAHSTMGGLVVGNYVTTQPKAFIYDIYTQAYFDISIPDLISITAYGIGDHGDKFSGHSSGKHQYTICGGFVSKDAPEEEKAYLVDWNNEKQRLSNFRVYTFGNETAAVTHFDGITSDGCGGYNLTGDYIKLTDGVENGFYAHVRRDKTASWTTLQFPPNHITSGNTVFGYTALGVYVTKNGLINGYISKPKKA